MTPSQKIYWGFWAVAAAFGTYFCMYTFRKPFTAATFEGVVLGGVALKALLVGSQIAGYALAKVIGIKVISEMPAGRRAGALILLLALAEASLLLFAVVPLWAKPACLFGNGLSLGMVFGLVLGFLEGRQLTEALTAGLCASFIVADGFSKSIGAWLLSQGVSPFWMPATAGGLFFLPLLACVAMLARTPPPDDADITERAERTTMDRSQRWSLYRRHALGLSMIVAIYLLVTSLRSIRADFAPEIWAGLGESAAPSLYTRSEVWVALGVVLVNGLTVLLRDNRAAFYTSLGICGAGLLLVPTAIVARQQGLLTPFWFMVLIGLGLYLPYVAIHTTVFERFLAFTRERGTLGYLMYVADAVGYVGYFGVMLAHGALASKAATFDRVFDSACWLIASLSLVCLLVASLAFLRRDWQTPRPSDEG